jgi:ABC-type transport system involved in multi-copper enzyme maturation permease subunit
VTWLAWRQFRTSAVIAATTLVAIAILLGATTHGAHVLSCAAGGCPDSDGKLWHLSHDRLLQILSTLLVALPAVIGVFWGAPLIARELESGTYRLAWTQSVTRTRWLATKLVLVGIAGAVLCGLTSGMLGWWSSKAINRDRLAPAMFAERGIAPIGYALFALALAVAAGVLIRRTLPAMAVSLVGFTGVRMIIQFFVRAHLLSPSHLTYAINANSAIGIGIREPSGQLSLQPVHESVGSGWAFSTRIVDKFGHGPTSQFIRSACGKLPGPPSAGPNGPGTHQAPPAAVHSFQHCLASVGQRYHEVVTYQPNSHYWGLQLLETAIFLAMAGLLVGVTFWSVRRRLA